MEAAAPTPLRTMLSSSEPGVTKSLLFKSGRDFFEWLSCGKREGGFPPLLDKDSVSDSSDKRFSSVVEDEPSGNYRNTSQTSVIDLIHDTHHLCTRFRIDRIKAMSRGIFTPWDPITRSEQFPWARVMAFSLTSLFLERFWGELRISFRSHKPVIKTKTPKNGIFDFFNEVSFSFVTSYIYNALMNGAELPFSR